MKLTEEQMSDVIHVHAVEMDAEMYKTELINEIVCSLHPHKAAKYFPIDSIFRFSEL